MSRIIVKNCRKCGLQFSQPALQGSRPVEYCCQKCRMAARRRRNAAAMRAKWARKKALGFKSEERIEELGM